MAAKKSIIQKALEPKIEEHDIETEILDWLNQQPQCMAVKYESRGLYDPVSNCFRKSGKYVLEGSSDVLAVWKRSGSAFSVPVWIEVKRPNHNTKKDHLEKQKSFQIKMKARGCICFFAESLKEVEYRMKHFDKTGNVILP